MAIYSNVLKVSCYNKVAHPLQNVLYVYLFHYCFRLNHPCGNTTKELMRRMLKVFTPRQWLYSSRSGKNISLTTDETPLPRWKFVASLLWGTQFVTRWWMPLLLRPSLPTNWLRGVSGILQVRSCYIRRLLKSEAKEFMLAYYRRQRAIWSCCKMHRIRWQVML
jgi:hypothetical protein